MRLPRKALKGDVIGRYYKGRPCQDMVILFGEMWQERDVTLTDKKQYVVSVIGA